MKVASLATRTLAVAHRGMACRLGGLVFLGMVCVGGGCNLITGAHELEVKNETPSSSAGGAGGETSSGGADSTGGFGGAVPTECNETTDCIHPDGCLVGACQEGSCVFSRRSCPDDQTCSDGACRCDQADMVVCDGICVPGVCCPGDTDGGCGNCGIRTCEDDRSGYACQDEGECSPGEVCSLVSSSNAWSDGSSCGCGVGESARCSDTCAKGSCE